MPFEWLMATALYSSGLSDLCPPPCFGFAILILDIKAPVQQQHVIVVLSNGRNIARVNPSVRC
jgi:hypothetical protein